MKGGILLLSAFDIMETKSLWSELSLMSSDLFLIPRFICSISDLSDLFCSVNFLRSGAVCFTGACHLAATNSLLSFCFNLFSSLVSALLQ